MINQELVDFCKQTLVSRVDTYFKGNPNQQEIKIVSNSNAIEMMMVNDELLKDKSISWGFTEVTSGAKGSHFMIKRNK